MLIVVALKSSWGRADAVELMNAALVEKEESCKEIRSRTSAERSTDCGASEVYAWTVKEVTTAEKRPAWLCIPEMINTCLLVSRNQWVTHKYQHIAELLPPPRDQLLIVLVHSLEAVFPAFNLVHFRRLLCLRSTGGLLRAKVEFPSFPLKVIDDVFLRDIDGILRVCLSSLSRLA